MGRARVAERVGQERQHGLEDLSAEWCGRRVVQVDRHARDSTPGSLLATGASSVQPERGRKPVSMDRGRRHRGGHNHHRSPSMMTLPAILVVVLVAIALAAYVFDTVQLAGRIGDGPSSIDRRPYGV